MHEKSRPSGHSKKSGKNIKEKRAAKLAKKDAQVKLRKGWTENK